MSEKALERAEGGHGISEDSCRRMARALGLQEDAFVGEMYIPGPEEAMRMIEQKDMDRDNQVWPSDSIAGIEIMAAFPCVLAPV